MRIALGQIDMGFENKEAAMALCSQLMAEAKEAAVDFVIFPEMTLTGFTLNPETYGEDRENSPSIDFFREEAKKNGVAVCFGLPVYENGVATNHCIYLDENGEQLADYAKNNGYDVLVGVGGGVVCDFAKLCSHFSNLPVINVPTSSATCASL